MLTNYPQILDGFCYGTIFGTRPLQGANWYWNCLQNETMQNLRLSADNYRPRVFICPKQFTNPANTNSTNILPGKTEFLEFQVRPGSYLWGLTFAVNNDGIVQSKFSVMIRESFTGMGIYDRPQAGQGIKGGSTVTTTFNTLNPPIELLPEPRLILEPAQIHCEVSNDSQPGSDNNVSCQLAMFFLEPK